MADEPSLLKIVLDIGGFVAATCSAVAAIAAWRVADRAATIAASSRDETKAQVDLMREERADATQIRFRHGLGGKPVLFGKRKHYRQIAIWIANLSARSFVVESVLVQGQYEKYRPSAARIVSPGKRAFIKLPDFLWDTVKSYGEDFEVSFVYNDGLKSFESNVLGFTVRGTGGSSNGYRITKGFSAPRFVSCPTCATDQLMYRAINCNSAQEAMQKYEKQIIEELEASCPNHQSRLAESILNLKPEQEDA